MKPYELIAALMHQEGGSLPLARKMGNPRMQSKLYKFAAGTVGSPTRPTAEALAAYFKLPVDAIYDEKLATSIARERGISALPAELAAASVKPVRGKSPEEKEIKKVADRYRKLSPTERERFRLLMQVASLSVPDDDDRRPRFGNEPGESNLGGLDEIKPKKAPKGRRE